MNHQKKCKAGLALLLLTLSIGPLFGGRLFARQPQDSLWLKAVEIADKNELWIPGLLLDDEKVFNEEGKVEEHTESQIHFFRTGNGSIDMKLLKSTMNGKDISESQRKKLENCEDYFESNESEEPFARRLQKNISAIRLLETQWLDSTECAVFEYRQKAEDAEWQGMAWLEKSTGLPLKIQFKTDRTFKEDDAKIKNFTGVILYKHDDLQAWYPLEMQYEMQIEAKLFPFFTFKGRVENKVVLNDYFSYYETKN